MRKKILVIGLIATILFAGLTEHAAAQFGGTGAFGEVMNYLKRFATNIIPSKDNAYDIGSSSKGIKDIYVKGTANIATVSSSGTAERITGTTYGEYIDFNDAGDDFIVFGGGSGTADATIRFDLDNTNNYPGILGDKGRLILGGHSGTGGNNEDIQFDFDSTANTILLSSNTGAVDFDYGVFTPKIRDGKYLLFGTTNRAKLQWSTVGNDCFRILVDVNNAGYSGNIIVQEQGDSAIDFGQPLVADPHFRIQSSDGTQVDDYIQFYHDQTNGVIDVGNGVLTIPPQIAFTPTAAQVIDAATDTVLANASMIVLNPDGNYDLTSTPHIADGTVGQVLYITMANDEANTVAINDQDTVAGSNCQLGAAERVVGAKDVLVLMFDGTDWLEVSYANN